MMVRLPLLLTANSIEKLPKKRGPTTGSMTPIAGPLFNRSIIFSVDRLNLIALLTQNLWRNRVACSHVEDSMRITQRWRFSDYGVFEA